MQRLFETARKRLSDRWLSLRYYGGFRFYNRPIRGNRWKNFAQYRFIVPRLELNARKGRAWLALNLKLGEGQDAQAELRAAETLLAGVAWCNATEAAVPPVVSREDLPDFHGWRTLIQQALSTPELDKVVLARECTFTTQGDVDPVALLARLREQTMQTYDYCFQPVPGKGFVGLSPERLYRRENCFIQSEAVAGTRPRGKSEEGDEALGAELLGNEKEMREHQYVVRMVRDILSNFCSGISVEAKPGLLRLRHCQHLHTKVEGILKANECDAPLLEALHPTPAVGGSPRELALQWLIEHEPFDRGIFAAPIGWIGYDAAEFAVAIRSALVRGNELSVYSGAGIVRGSVAEEEWDEIENKIANFLRVLPHADS
jgi:menaquinone-specific isochorismate synthase